MQGSYAQRRQPQAEKRPAALCRHLACLKQHSSDDCCICSGQGHPIEKCWHVTGLPAGKQHMADQFKLLHQQLTGPWINQPRVQSATLSIKPNVSAILIPHKLLVLPSLTTSGRILSEAEGDLHDVKEMDFGFTSSFLCQHLSPKPNVSAIPNAPKTINLLDDSPEVNFISTVNRTDTVLAHVDTGATVMVSNVIGEVHVVIPTTSHCGTAMTGSRTSTDAIGTWMVEIVGLLGNQDLPLALCGTTQTTTFQQRSMSLHSLKDLGINCAHCLTQAGNFLDISVNGITHVFPLLTINGGDYVEMRIHCPPPASVAEFSVARLDLAKNFEHDGLYYLLHLQYGCPGWRAMELILQSDSVTGVPANVSIPETFHCPICDKEKTNLLPANEISDRTSLPIGARFGADSGFYNQTSVRGFVVSHAFCLLLSTSQDTNGFSADDLSSHL
jgi:hypothetical protein